MEQGSFIINELTGDWMVYPGHPLVLATAIMKVFPTLSAANERSGDGPRNALTDNRIPGAGDHVGAALRVLKLGADGASEDAMVEYAANYWNQGNAGGHSKNVEAGRKQARTVEPHFRELAKVWLAR